MLPAFREGITARAWSPGVGAAATILEGGEVDLGGDADEDLPAWMIFTDRLRLRDLPAGHGAGELLFLPPNRSKCRKLTLKQQSQQVLSVTRNDRLVEYTCVRPELRCGRGGVRATCATTIPAAGPGRTIIGGGFDAAWAAAWAAAGRRLQVRLLRRRSRSSRW